MSRKTKRKLETKLEQVFGISFPELISKYFKKGDSRYEVQKRLLELIVEKGLVDKATEVFVKQDGKKIVKITEGKWNPEKWEYDKFGAVSVYSNPAFRPSTLYHAIKHCIEEGELNSFDFTVTNKGRKTDGVKRQPTITIELECKQCGRKHKNNAKTDPEDLNLRVYPCPACGTYGQCVAKITESGKVHYKAVVKINGLRKETTVVSNTDLTPVENNSPGYRKTKSIPLDTNEGNDKKDKEVNDTEHNSTATPE